MLDTKKIIQLGLGVAAGMVAYHFIEKAMNKSSLSTETIGASGWMRKSLRANGVGKTHRCSSYSFPAGTTCESQCANVDGSTFDGVAGTCTVPYGVTFGGGTGRLVRR